MSEVTELLSTADAVDPDELPWSVLASGAPGGFRTVAVSQPVLFGDRGQDAWRDAELAITTLYESISAVMMELSSRLRLPDETLSTFFWDVGSETGALLRKSAYSAVLTELLRMPDVRPAQDILEGLGYAVRRPLQVSSFLLRHPPLTGIVTEAQSRIAEHFPQADLILEVRKDPEVTREELFIFIRTALVPDDALERLEALEDDWWLDVLPEVAGILCINLEFE
jgi:hypothetical protein